MPYAEEGRIMRRLGKLFFATVLFVATYSSLFAEETLNITTYYPSPYGSYNELRTYGNTYLATDSGNVGIGTTKPGYKLEVAGSISVNSGTTQVIRCSGGTYNNVLLTDAATCTGAGGTANNTSLYVN
jgi:hypothetical protein